MDSLDVETLVDLVKRRYGDRLSPEQLEKVREKVRESAEHAQKMRSVKLQNGDEPFSVFTPFRGRD